MGARNSDVIVDQGICRPVLCCVFHILYSFLASLARLAVRSGRSRDIEIIVLRHQLAVLRRQHDRQARTRTGATGVSTASSPVSATTSAHPQSGGSSNTTGSTQRHNVRRSLGPSPHAGRQHVRRTLDWDAAPRAARPHHRLEPTTTRTPHHRLHQPSQRSPAAPLARSTTGARNRHTA